MRPSVAKKLVIFSLIAATTVVTACRDRAENGGDRAPLVVAPEAVLPPTAEVEATDGVDSSPAGGESGGTTAEVAPTTPLATDTAQAAGAQEELPLIGAPAPAAATESCVVYQNARVADEQLPVVYTTPSVQAEAIGRLGRNHWANAVSWRNGWYEIAVAPERTGWIWGSSVGTNAPCAGLQPQAADLPIAGLPTAPPVTGCVVVQNGLVADDALPLVYAAPSANAAQVGRLGRNHWADGLQRQGEWIEIVVQAGATGWVRESGVALSADCPAVTASMPELPLIANRGAPANTRCVAMNLWGAEQPVAVYGGAEAGQP
ncbi:MAG: hypothetical protein RRC07_17700, partial [Anaerolineae bacterium]|nr:hypothetical protein [Anaerolineae bacterium]